MNFDLSICHKVFKMILFYRTPDSTNTDALLQYISNAAPDVALGDMNLDFPKFKNMIYENVNMVNIVKQPTRIQKSRNRRPGAEPLISSTCIDHIYVKPSLKSKVTSSVIQLDRVISDHCLLKLEFEMRSPPVKLTIPVVLDPYRRYFPKGGVDWNKFPCTFCPHGFSKMSVSEYYDQLVTCVKRDCELMKITFKKSLAPRKVFRFALSREARTAKYLMHQAKYRYKESKNEFEFEQNNYAATIGTPFHRECWYRLKRARMNMYNDHQLYKEMRNNRNRLVTRDKYKYYENQFNTSNNDTKKLWNIVNRSKGIVRKTVESLDHIQYHPECMADFFYQRSKIALSHPLDHVDTTFDWAFPEPQDLPDLCSLNITITDDDIDEAMRYKPSSCPDPDSISMLIWQKLYENNETYKKAIRLLFYKALHGELEIPGLALHEVLLYLKSDVVKRQKDLRPVASLTSLPKRMLRIVFTQVKEARPGVFYKPTDFAQPNAGAMALVMTTYERCERGHFGLRGKPKKTRKTSIALFDKSNAFNTFFRAETIQKLSIAGTARQIICRAIVSQSLFRVRTTAMKSRIYTLKTGGPQGQCGTAEIFASLVKRINPPDPSHIDPTASIHGHDYVDDNSAVVVSSTQTHPEVIELAKSSMNDDCDQYGLCDNPEKFKLLEIGASPMIEERMLGMITNTNLNSHSEIGPTLSRLKKVVATTRACAALSKRDRLKIAKYQIHSRLSNFVFIITYCTQTKCEYFRKQVNLAFKKAAYIPLDCPTALVENFLYGMPFKDYATLRIYKFCETQKKFGNEIMNAIEIRGLGRAGRNSQWRNKYDVPIGTLLRRYCEILNSHPEKSYFENLVKNKKPNVAVSFREILSLRPFARRHVQLQQQPAPS